jgi:hypothetical protein
VELWHIWVGIIALYVAVCAAIVWRVRRLRREVAASSTWPSVASRVVESRMDEIHSVKGGTTFFPVVIYDYTVDGRALRGARMHFGDPVGYSFRRRADRRLADLTAAAAIQVHHDPADPTHAVIERRAPILRRDAVLLGILLVVLAGILTFPLWL